MTHNLFLNFLSPQIIVRAPNCCPGPKLLSGPQIVVRAPNCCPGPKLLSGPQIYFRAPNEPLPHIYQEGVKKFISLLNLISLIVSII